MVCKALTSSSSIVSRGNFTHGLRISIQNTNRPLLGLEPPSGQGPAPTAARHCFNGLCTHFPENVFKTTHTEGDTEMLGISLYALHHSCKRSTNGFIDSGEEPTSARVMESSPSQGDSSAILGRCL